MRKGVISLAKLGISEVRMLISLTMIVIHQVVSNLFVDLQAFSLKCDLLVSSCPKLITCPTALMSASFLPKSLPSHKLTDLTTSLLSLHSKSSILCLHPRDSGRVQDKGKPGLVVGVCNPSIARAFAGMYDMLGDNGECVSIQWNGEEHGEGEGRRIAEI